MVAVKEVEQFNKGKRKKGKKKTSLQNLVLL